MVDPRTLKTADFDNDGRIDIVASDNSTGKLSWFRNRGESWERKDIQGLLTIHGHFGTVADVDKDGRIDIIQPTYQGIQLVQNVDSGTTWKVFPLATFEREPMQIVLSEVDLGDLDLDGKADIVFTVSVSASSSGARQRGGLYWLRQTASSWETFEIFSEDSSAVGVQLVDYDQDGDLDIIMNSEFQRHGISIFFNKTIL
jgi:hypothetical protein